MYDFVQLDSSDYHMARVFEVSISSSRPQVGECPLYNVRHFSGRSKANDTEYDVPKKKRRVVTVLGVRIELTTSGLLVEYNDHSETMRPAL